MDENLPLFGILGALHSSRITPTKSTNQTFDQISFIRAMFLGPYPTVKVITGGTDPSVLLFHNNRDMRKEDRGDSVHCLK
jgi:hypothetical protein